MRGQVGPLQAEFIVADLAALATPVQDVPLREDMLHYGVHELPVTWDD